MSGLHSKADIAFSRSDIPYSDVMRTVRILCMANSHRETDSRIDKGAQHFVAGHVVSVRVCN